MIHPLRRLGASTASMTSSSSSDHRHQGDKGRTLLGFPGHVSKPPHHSEQEKGSGCRQQTKKQLHISDESWKAVSSMIAMLTIYFLQGFG
jgi:hypothetical protein